MYLKSIEVQGFKSFANKILFDFHNGITGIVGPNGSGKSNVADAVRWVLGEQSAKQLRGSKMEDVIFAGTQNRKPVGFAHVSITLDNSDHALPVDYEEVTVSRRVYRSGESEYQMNGNNCRLKDIVELFYDTGIGKEGYSIIGQGQIDKILSGKPDERRELFDEAAGIVKFKRRKAAASKKLENEKANLVRVNDILSELEKQVGPLEKQSEKAKEYINLKTELKTYDVNAFLLESDKIREETAQLDEKILISDNDLEAAKNEYESTRQEYEETEQLLLEINNDYENTSSLLSNSNLEKQRLESEISLLNEQIKTIEANKGLYSDRINSIGNEISSRNVKLEELYKELDNIEVQAKEYDEILSNADKKQALIEEEIKGISDQIESRQQGIFDILNQKSEINAENQKYVTMLENLNIKKSECNSRIIQNKSEQDEQSSIIKDLQKQVDADTAKFNEINEAIKNDTDSMNSLREQNAELNSQAEKLQTQYHREKSKLESLVNLTERYEGYGGSIRKIMELKDSNPGILGVIADIVKVDRKYEVAVETALGGTIQNIVTDKETTAKELINYLKTNKLGRATFLPLNSIQGRNTLETEDCIKENGVVGVASSLVKVSFEYEKLAKYLLGRILVVDNIDNALAIAKKYKYSLRIVTLEGEQLNPGGSMTGGAFKNSSNLLGRRREIEELKKNVSEFSTDVNSIKKQVSDNRAVIGEYRTKIENNNKALREAQVARNTSQMTLNQANMKLKEIQDVYNSTKAEIDAIEKEIKDINTDLNNVSGNLANLDNQNEASRIEIDNLTKLLEEKKAIGTKELSSVEEVRLKKNLFDQQNSFINENISRIKDEIESFNNEVTEIKQKISQTDSEVVEKQDEIKKVTSNIDGILKQVKQCEEKLSELKKQRNEVNENHKAFFDKREALNNSISSLDKESFRLHAQKEKLDSNFDNLTDYMWNEYELTYNYAKEFRKDDLGSLNEIKKHINILKNDIKKLGDVNVNAIEEFKSVNERYQFLKKQHDDLIEAEASLTGIIDDLDKGMRIQFAEKFEEIKVEFDKVFKELFGGGRGTIELVEGEDILEAGINIISQPPGKKLQNMMQLSGGEKALTAISLLFAIQNLKPSPFCLLDEIEAALDDSNVGRYANYLHKLTEHTQFIVITHRRGTMAAADRLYGITMQEKGVSALVSVDLISNELDNNSKKN